MDVSKVDGHQVVRTCLDGMQRVAELKRAAVVASGGNCDNIDLEFRPAGCVEISAGGDIERQIEHRDQECIVIGSRDVCPSCGSRHLRSYSAVASDLPARQRISLRECIDCDLAWQWPLIRSFENSVQHAEDRYGHAENHAYYQPEARARVAKEQVGYLASLPGVGPELLDVGAGDGAFVRMAQAQGWSALGIDPAAPQGSGDALLIRSTLDELPDDRRFDVVTLWDVIEHLEAPMDVVAAAVARLKPGGYLVVETGNYQSGDRVSAGEDWWAFAADHRWYFGPPAVARMMTSLGLETPQLAPRVLRPGWKGQPCYQPWAGGMVRAAIRRPHRSLHEVLKYLRLRQLSSKWPEWSGLQIFTMSARRPAAS